MSAHIHEILSDVTRVYNQKVIVDRIKGVTPYQVKSLYLLGLRQQNEDASAADQKLKEGSKMVKSKFDGFFDGQVHYSDPTKKTYKTSFSHFMTFLKSIQQTKMEIHEVVLWN